MPLFKKKEKTEEKESTGPVDDMRVIQARHELPKPKKEPEIDWMFIVITGIFGILILMTTFLYPSEISEGFYNLLMQIDKFLWTPLTLFPVWSAIVILVIVWLFGDLFKREIIVNGQRTWYIRKFEEDGILYFTELRYLGRKKIAIYKKFLEHNGAQYFTIIDGFRMWDPHDNTLEIYQTSQFREVSEIRWLREYVKALQNDKLELLFFIEHNTSPNIIELEKLTSMIHLTTTSKPKE
jgi:hypothetical protein